MKLRVPLQLWLSSIAVSALALFWWRRRRRLRSPPAKRRWAGIEARASRIANAGDGLYATRDFAAGEVLGQYYGRVLSLLQVMKLENRDYVMGGFGSINVHVDARFALDSPARYVNDNFDTSALNARFDKLKEQRRALLVATRPIKAGEEVYAAYGEAYWRARDKAPSASRAAEP